MRSIEPLVAPESEYYNCIPGALARDYFLYPVCVGDFTYLPGYSLSRVSFGSWLLEVILSGEVKIESDGIINHATAGDVVLLDCHKPHAYYSKKGWRALWVHFDGNPAAGYGQLAAGQHEPVLSGASFTEVRTILEAIFHTVSHPDPDKDARLSLLLTQALTSALTSAAENTRDPRRVAIENIIARINRSPGDEPTIAEMARMASLSEYHFIRVFKQCIGVTPRQYLIAARMNQARYLLANTDLTITEIARQVGYASDSMFCQIFKKTQNTTPTAYRVGKEETT